MRPLWNKKIHTMHFKHILLILFLSLTHLLLAQEVPEHPHKMYQSPDGKLYVNRNDPIYLRIAASPEEDTNSHLLRSEASQEYTNPMYFDAEGYNTVRSPWKVDPETRKYVKPREDVVFVVYADSKPPQSQIKWDARDMARKEQTVYLGEPISLNFQTRDALSGTASVYYSLNESPYQPFEPPLRLDQEKTYRLKYYAVDRVGNAEKPKQVKIVVDLGSPSTTLEIEGDRYENVISGRSGIVLQAKDQITSVQQTRYSLDGAQMKSYRVPLKASEIEEGEHTLTYFSVDRVNNQEKKREFHFFVDKTPPRVMEEITGNTFTADGKEYFSGKNRLKFISMDNKAGVQEIRYSINNSAFKVYHDPIALTESGNLSIETVAIDRVNNKKRTHKLTNRSHVSYVDLAGPELSHDFEGPVFQHKDSTFITSETTIILKGKDGESGFKKMEYTAGRNQPSTRYKKPFSLEEEGVHHLRYSGYDNLDNSSSHQFSCTVDDQGPKIFHRFSSPSRQDREIKGKSYPVYPSHVALFLSATDAGAGFDRLFYSLNGREHQYESMIERFSPDELYHLEVTAVDKLGNQQTRSIDFYIE